MAERRVTIRHAVPQPREGQRVPILVVAWPPVREGGPWTVEVRAPRDAVTARIVTPPIAFIDDPEAELLAEQFIAQRIPATIHDLLLPKAVVASETLQPLRPSDFVDAQAYATLIRRLVNA
ncbi:MAG: hypothetical protein H5U08_08950 [Thermogutta sp.]|uniref:hypothetical protein n=1 Tax=Thermogutta sp. TaxID=1962930 RepID=UPI0019A38128|nr:hypothetical protein [Thermogutta sp.]MBC7352471.1 hypothetical protein [Thermogutta sp.]